MSRPPHGRKRNHPLPAPAQDDGAPADGEQVRQHMWRLAAVYGAVGIEVAACVVGGALAGHYADLWLSASPWGFFAGTTVGCVAAVKAVVRLVRLGRRG